MTCRAARSRLSAHMDGELPVHEGQAVAAHLDACPGCAEMWRSLRDALCLLRDLPAVEPPCESISSRVFDRLDVESRGPGLALIFRPAWRARPHMLPSLLQAVLVLVAVMAAVLTLDRERIGPASLAMQGHVEVWEGRLPPSGTEGNPLFPSAGVGVPRVRARGDFPAQFLAETGEGTLFLETVVARDGSVSTVTLLEGDRELARPLLDVLRRERFDPVRFRGRPVAVSVYRLISRMEVRPPST